MFFTIALVWFGVSLVAVGTSYAVDDFVCGFVNSVQTLAVFAVLLAAFGT